MADNKPPVVSADTDISGKKNRKARAAILWRKLGDGIKPTFNLPFFLFALNGSDNEEEEYKVGYLDEIRENEEGEFYYWVVEGHENPLNHFTHYAPCEPPVD